MKYSVFPYFGNPYILFYDTKNGSCLESLHFKTTLKKKNDHPRKGRPEKKCWIDPDSSNDKDRIGPSTKSLPGQFRFHQGQATENGNYAEAGPVPEAIDMSESKLYFEKFLSHWNYRMEICVSEKAYKLIRKSFKTVWTCQYVPFCLCWSRESPQNHAKGKK